jgi:ribosomal-protein-alanine N-acetyltransferase
LGFLVAQVIDQEWELENIVVAAPDQRRGLGSQLLHEFLDLICREHAEAAFLEVRESNHAARRLYEKFAFKQTGRRPHYYTQPDEDALTYRLNFP